ncbi:7518_t:CDS:2 [Entrophospora sp. SA101]|nr:7518_t:CDS:2 [Entrophospora sp. SA101]
MFATPRYLLAFSLKLFVSTTNLAVAVINEETSDIVLVNDVVLDHDHRLWRNIKTAFYKESLSERKLKETNLFNDLILNNQGNNLVYQNVDYTNINYTPQNLAHNNFIQQIPFDNSYINQNLTIPQNNLVDQNNDTMANNSNVLINQDLTNAARINHHPNNTFDNNFIGQSSHQNPIGANNFVNNDNDQLPLLVNIVAQLQTLQNDVINAIKFDIQAHPEGLVKRKCITQYVPTDTLVVVTIKVGIGYNQQIDVEVTDNSPAHNEYGRKRDMNEETRIAFTTHVEADVSICFTNTLEDGFSPDAKYHRTIDLDIDVGAEAIDYNQLAKAEKLKPMEAELRKLEQIVQEIVDEMEYLRRREARMRDTNESTNERVKWFSLGTIFVLVALGGWQIFYLKKFFQRKRLID